MNHNTPVSPRPLSQLFEAQRRVMTAAQLRSHGVTAARIATQCRPGGPWQQILPGVHLLHPGPPTSEERLQAVLLYAKRPPGNTGSVPGQSPRPAAETSAPDTLPDEPIPYEGAMVTGLAALALHGFASAPPLLSLDRLDVLVPRSRRLKSTGCARIVRSAALPRPQQVTGIHVAPVPRALAHAVEQLSDAPTVRRLLTEAVRAGHCEPAAVVRELEQARLLDRPHVVDAVESLLAEGRAIAEDLLFRMVREQGLPDPVWNVDLRLPGGPHLGEVDAYWPDQAVAVELDTRVAGQTDGPGLRHGPALEDDALWSACARRREHLEQLGITVVHITPKKLHHSLEQQATVVRTALMASTDRDPAAYVVVLPR